MADVQALDAKTGQSVNVPQEAVASEYAKGRIYFPPGTRVPVTLNGQEGTIPEDQLDDAIHEGGAELNYDPSGATKAAAAGALRGASLGMTDWLAIEGQKLLGNPEGAESTRKSLEGLRESHPDASTAGEVGGALASMFIPGGEEAGAEHLAGAGNEAAHGLEAGAAALDPAQAALHAKDAATSIEAAQTAANLRQASDAASAVAQTDASSGRTVGSALGTLFRHANAPNRTIGRAGQVAQDFITPLFGDSAIAGPAGTLAKFATEGALIDAANAADESELGGTDLTGETLYASLEHGALYGSLLGVVGTGAEKALTAAGRLASRVAEGRLGGTAGQYRKSLERWGPGALGSRALEEGIETPFATDAEKYDRAKVVSQRDGQLLDGIAREADAAYNGTNAAASRGVLYEAIDHATEEGRLAGGNLDALNERLKSEYDKAIGWKGDPSPLPRLPEDAARHLYEEAWRKEAAAGLLDPTTPPPREVTSGQVRARWRELMDAEGLSGKMERSPKGVKPADLEAYRQKLVTRFAGATDLAERQQIGVQLATPGALEAGARQEIEATIAARNARREELRTKAADDLNERFALQKDTWDKAMARHEELRADAARKVSEAQGHQDRTYAHMVSAVRRANGDLRVPFTKMREYRAKLDDIIPYNRGSDAMTNAAVEMKRSARSALEAHVERSLDEAAQKTGNPELLARYVHAKARYGQAKDIERMLERQRGREASRFGREVFGHNGGIIGHGIAGLVFGHPVAGAAAGVARKYAPTVGAWAMHKVSRFAEMKALRSEVEVAMRRSARAAASGRTVPRFATVGVPNLPPHELRATAAEAMLAIMKTAKGTDLPARLAALDPSLPILAPRASQAVEGTARRALTWIASKVPARVHAAMAQGHEPSGRDLSDAEARDFLEGVAVAHDPRVVTDAMAHGQLTPNLAKGLKAVWPALHAQTSATIARQAAMDKPSHDTLTPWRKSQLAMLGPMPTLSPKGMTMALQQSAAAMAGGAAPKPTPAGKVNAASGLSKMTGASLLQTTTQALENGTPGRRGRKSAGVGI